MTIGPTPTATMPPLLEQRVERLVARQESSPTRSVIALVGVPGAGKTTLASRMAEVINTRTAPDTMVALGMDGFHFTKAALQLFPNPAEAFARRGAPWTFDAVALQHRLQALRASAGRSDVSWPGFEHAVGDPVEGASTVSASTRLVIVEGLYLVHRGDGWEAVNQCFDERWYLDTPLEIAFQHPSYFSPDAMITSVATARRIKSWIAIHGRALPYWTVLDMPWLSNRKCSSEPS
jgi:pantothenate kinase